MTCMGVRRRIVATVLMVSVALTSVASAAVTATSRQQQAVTDSLGTASASAAVRNSLNDLANDSMENTTLFDTCKLAVSCSWGSGSSWVALYGDSHAPMWASALVPALTAKGLRVAMNWLPGCTPAHLAVQSPSAACTTTWRSTAEKAEPAQHLPNFRILWVCHYSMQSLLQITHLGDSISVKR